MRRRLSFTCGLFCALLLAGCSSSDTLTYDVTLDAPNDAKALELLLDLEQVVERRAAQRLEVGDIAISTAPGNDNDGVLTISGFDSDDERTAVMDMLAEPFLFEMKRDVTPVTQTGAQVERIWEATGITGTNLVWIEPKTHAETGAPGAELTFDDQGKEMLNELFTDYQGSLIGIFVRDLLVSAFEINPESDIRDRIIITGIPDARVAEVFADDVNVGLHVRLSLR